MSYVIELDGALWGFLHMMRRGILHVMLLGIDSFLSNLSVDVVDEGPRNLSDTRMEGSGYARDYG